MKAHAWVRALLACNLLTFAVLIGCGYALATGAPAEILGAVVATLAATFLVLNFATLRLADGKWEEEAPAATPGKRRKRKTASSVTWRADWNRKTEADANRRALN